MISAAPSYAARPIARIPAARIPAVRLDDVSAGFNYMVSDGSISSGTV